MEKTKKKTVKKFLITIVCICLLYYLVVKLLGNGKKGEGNKETCEAAELHVQSD